MDNTCRVHIFQSTENLIQEVLNELLFKRSGSEKTVKIGTQKLSDEVTGKSETAKPR